MAISYSRQTVDAVNPLARFAHRRRMGESLRRAADLARSGSVVLDYGCGPGLFLREMTELRPDLRLTGFDPYFAEYFGESQLPGVQLVDTMGAVEAGSVDLLTAFEVCEHLDDSELASFFVEAERVLAPEGRLLISVPVIGGPVLLLKEANRVVFHHRRPEYTPRELLMASVFGKPAHRDHPKDHKGFDFRALRRTTGAHFASQAQWLSPFPALPWFLNSQAFSLWQHSGSSAASESGGSARGAAAQE